MLKPISSAIVAVATPAEAAALLRLDLLTAAEMVCLAERWLMEGLDGDSLEIAWIAGQPSPTLYEIGPAFTKAVSSLTGDPPDLRQAAKTAARLYVGAIADGRAPPYEGMRAIDQDLDLPFLEAGERLVENPELKREPGVRYVGDRLGLQSLYGWYSELQDVEDGVPSFYGNDLPRDAQIAKLTEELHNAARRYVERLEAP